MKTNQYISSPYPFEIPLSEKKTYRPKKYILTNFDLKNFVKKKLFHLNYKDLKKSIYSKKKVSEKIFSFLTNKDLFSGSQKEVKKYKKLFISQFDYFIKKKQPIVFNVTQFAFKIPNPLKTNNTLPDLGELAFLSQFYDITKVIKDVYSPGAKIIIYGESYVFNKVVGLTFKEADLYYRTISKWIVDLGWNNNLVLYDLKKLSKKIPDFNQEYKNNLNKLRNGLLEKKGSAFQEIENTVTTMCSSINVRRFDIETLAKIYGKNNKFDKKILALRKKIFLKAVRNSLPYLAYHKTINTSQLSNILFPNSIKLSFTYGPKKISLYTINKESKLYPYHGVPVLGKKGKVIIKYEFDVLRNKKVATYYIASQNEPFFYKFI